MVAAAGWGEALGVTPAGTGARIERVLRAYGLPTERDERLTRAHLAAVMALDKKAEGDGVRCVLLTKIGACTGTVIRGAQLEALLYVHVDAICMSPQAIQRKKERCG